MKTISKLKITLLAAFFAIAMAASCIGINVAKADAAANGVPITTNTVTKGVPGKMTVENEIKTALMPLGHSLYIYAGGWNEEYDPSRGDIADTGANPETMTIGVPQIWADFYSKQDSSYDCDIEELDYYEHPECVHWATDCSGYLGWVFQNIKNEPNGFDTNGIGNPGWVTYAQNYGFALEHKEFGKRIVNPNTSGLNEDEAEDIYGQIKSPSEGYDYRPGDIYTFECHETGHGEYHCWLCLGQCEDGSMLIIHNSPPGACICAITPETGAVNKAVQVSNTYMKRYYTDFYNKFGSQTRLGTYGSANASATGYLKYSQFQWGTALADDEGLRSKTAEQILKYIYNEVEANASLNYSGQVPVIKFNDALVEPSATANSQIVYNEKGDGSAVDVSFTVPAGYKFDSVKINDVDYSASLVANSNTAKVTAPKSADYKIECASSEVVVNPGTEIAKTGDANFAVIAICILWIIASGALITKKELG